MNTFFTRKRKRSYALICIFMGIAMTFLNGCGEAETPIGVSATKTAPPQYKDPEVTQTKGSRDNTPICLVPEAPGEVVYENEYARLDASNASEGYVVVTYIGESPKVKLQITGPGQRTYTYDLQSGVQKPEVFPLQTGNGEYMINVFENIQGTQYSQAFSQLIDVTITNEFTPFLYPNQYCTFDSSTAAIKKAEELAFVCDSDIEVVSEVYNYIIANIEYDHAEAESVESGYLPNVDEVLSTKKGICLDYSSLMTAMLRSQRIPTRMEIGYAGTAYHAWLSTYIEDIGWVNGMIEFDGTEWSLMDPTFASNTKNKELKEFIGDGSNYSVKYIY